jgi:hypothetical protein
MGFLDQPLSLISIAPNRSFGGVNAYVTITESSNDTTTITKQPVQQGAAISDHKYNEPTTFSTSILFKNNLLSASLTKIYQNLLALQSTSVPFDVITPKRIYHNMLISTLAVTTDRNTENVLAVNVSFQEVIIVNVTTTQVPRTKQKNPGSNGATQNAGKKSAALSLVQGVGALFGAGGQ